MEYKLGRPIKYFTEEARKEAIRYQNMRNKRRERLRKRLQESRRKEKKISSTNDVYRESIYEFLNQANWSILFTGTIDTSDKDIGELRKTNGQIEKDIQKHEREIELQNSYKNNLKYLVKCTRYFIDSLYKPRDIVRYAYFFEKGKNGNYHVHILIDTKKKKAEVGKLLPKKWGYGSSDIKMIDNKTKENVIGYVIKGLKAESVKSRDLDFVDHWFIRL